MKKSKLIKITIQGITGLMLNKFTDAAAQKATDGNRTAQVGGKPTPKQEAESKLYTHEGTLIIPGQNIFKSLLEGGKYFRNGRSKVTTQSGSLMAGSVFVKEAYIPLKSKEGWKVDTRPVRIPSTGGRILAHRPLFDDWELSFTLEIDEEVISEQLVRQIIDAAGTRIGLGDFRPECKGMYGTYQVTLWKTLPVKKTPKRACKEAA